MALKQNGYDDIEINKIVFSYGVRVGTAPTNLLDKPSGKSITSNYKHYKLVNSMDPLSYGNIIDIIQIDEVTSKYFIQADSGNNFLVTVIKEDQKTINKIKLFSERS